MTRKQAIVALEAAIANVNAAIEAFHDSGSMCETTFDSLHNSRRNLEAEIVAAYAHSWKTDSNTSELIVANAD